MEPTVIPLTVAGQNCSIRLEMKASPDGRGGAEAPPLVPMVVW